MFMALYMAAECLNLGERLMPHYFDQMCLGVRNVKFVDEKSVILHFSTKNVILGSSF